MSAIITEKFRQHNARNFYESFSPDTGEGTGGKQFSWSAAIWLHLNAQRDTFTLKDEPKAK